LFNRRARCQKKIPRAGANKMTKNNINAKDPQKKETPKPDLKAVKGPSIEEIQKALANQIENFQRKSELISNREKFLKYKDQLNNFIADQGADFDDTLDSENLRVVLSDRRNYRDGEAIGISNNFIVREFINFIIIKIDAKVLELEKEILG
jgi:hypothetical protein